MSIHLDAFHPESRIDGIHFFADVNGKRISCLLDEDALRALAGRQETTVDSTELFKRQWLRVKNVAYAKLQNEPRPVKLVLTGSDF